MNAYGTKVIHILKDKILFKEWCDLEKSKSHFFCDLTKEWSEQ